MQGTSIGGSTASRRDGTYRPDIDGLRGIAVLAVVAFHAFPGSVPGGFVGVDVFFVISGFLISCVISRQLAAGRFTFADFYARRMKRILPALLVVLVACYAFGWFALLPDEYRQLNKHIAAGIGFVSNFALWNEAGYFDASASSKPLLHLWSLGIEEQFYLVWPLALWLLARMRRGALPLIVTLGAISFAINLATVRSAPVAAFYSPLSRFWELQLGCLLALLTRDWEPGRDPLPRRIADGLSIAGAVALALSMALIDTAATFPGWWAVLPTAGTFLLIASGPDGWFNRAVLARPALVWVGLISYPLYLWHWPLLSFASIVATGTPSAGARVTAVCASVVLAVATYVCIEKPIRFGTPRRFKIPALATAALLVGVVGYATFAQSGLPQRYPPEVRSLANFKYEFKTDARYPDCWVSADQPFDGFAPFCAGADGAHDLAVVWGDSHAARLYPGLKAVLGETTALAQFTRDACPPILDVGYASCQKSNAWVLDRVARLKPRTVILFAAWTHYQGDWNGPTIAKTQLLATIDALQQRGIDRVIVIGPAPVWKGGLPKLLYQAWNSSAFHVVPERLATGLETSVPLADHGMRSAVLSRHVAYFSLTDFFCTDQGCLTRAPGAGMHLVTWDSGHLTTEGATLVARQIVADGLFATNGARSTSQ